ncbi:MAG TPA: hypothetical protein VMX94_06785 [Armatimonadota bacterium]|nr:hypothetical protein [Armatimonadota bacterium]
MKTLALVIACISLTLAAVPVMRALVRAWELERTNFQGRRVPTGFGFMLVLAAAPVYAAMLFLSAPNVIVGSFLAALIGFGTIGLLDDIYGTREIGGFRGHLGLLRRGKVSTGLVKAVVGGCLGLGLGAVAARFDPAISLLNGLVIGLAANTLNLLDLRPGRAASCFWLGVLALAAARLGKLAIWAGLIPVLIPAVWLTMLDRSARVMLGDAGSNAVGAILGLALVYEAGVPARIVLVLIMIAVHLYAEKYSISELIEGNRVLRGVDRALGAR